MIKGYVLITGCSSGIGRYLAQALQQDGWGVIATDKTGGDGRLALDLSDSHSIINAVEKTEQLTGGRLYALINNAAVAYFGKLEYITRDDLRQQFEVNLFGVHELTERIIPIFKRNGRGRIISISSINGRVSFPQMGAYSASKFALEAMSDALRLELKGSGITVSLIEPGSIETGLRRNAVCRNFKPIEKKGRDPGIVYKKVRHALESRYPRIRYPAGQGYVLWLKRILPDALFDMLIRYE